MGGQFDNGGWPQILQLKDWTPSDYLVMAWSFLPALLIRSTNIQKVLT